MENNQLPIKNARPKSYLIKVFRRLYQEYKQVAAIAKQTKPFKIIEILNLSNTPKKAIFLIQVT